MATAAQLAPSSWEEARAFLHAECGLPAVIKPRRGVASILVGLAQTEDEARSMLEALAVDQTQVLADAGTTGAPVVQQYLRGDEWIVDTVSRDGEHKVVALWRYRKGERNGAPFVNLMDEVVGGGDHAAAAVADYACAALEALGWRWGPAHTEVMMTDDGPRLIEVNAGRFNGVDFMLFADVCYGANAYELAALSLLEPDAFLQLPSRPSAELRCHGRLVKLVSSVAGTLVALNHAEQLTSLSSLIRFETKAEAPGDSVERTVDLNTCAGFAHLLHTDAAVLEEDYETLRRLEPTLFSVR